MKQIHINDQGELLLIEALEKPERLILHDHHFEFTPSYRKKWIAYDQALTSAIKKGIKFRDQGQAQRILLEDLLKVKCDAIIEVHPESRFIEINKGQTFDLPNSYTAQVVETCKWYGNRDACANETCWDLNECQKSPAVNLAVLTPLKQEEKTNHDECLEIMEAGILSIVESAKELRKEHEIILKFLDWYDGDLGVLKDHNGLVNDYFSERNPLK